MEFKWSSNKIIALILFLFSLFYLYTAFQIPAYVIPRPVDSDLFPKVLGTSMLLLSILLFFEKKKEKVAVEDDTQLQGAQEEDTEVIPKWKSPQVQVGVSILAIIVYIFLFEKMGFLLSSVLFTFFLTLYLGYRKHVINLIVSLTVSVSFYVLLTKVLGVYLPTGWIPL